MVRDTDLTLASRASGSWDIAWPVKRGGRGDGPVAVAALIAARRPAVDACPRLRGILRTSERSVPSSSRRTFSSMTRAHRVQLDRGKFMQGLLAPGHPHRKLDSGRPGVPEAVVKRALELSARGGRLLPVR